jgi:hypothetical protein
VPLVKLFAAVGAIVLVIIAVTLSGWVTSPDFRPAPVGADRIPPATLMVVRSTELTVVAGGIWFVWSVLLKPWIRDRRISWDGWLMLALLTMWVQDCMCNYFNFTFMYNAYFINMGSWGSHLPGWQAPRQGNLPEPLIFMGGIYLWVTLLNVLVFCWAIRKLRVWLPKLSLLGHLPFAFLALVAIDLMTDIPGPWYGFYAYAAAPRFGTLWAGTPQQLPIYTVVLMSAHYTMLGLLRLYRNPNGESWAERGLSNLRIGERGKSLLRFLALVGFCNLSYFFIYMMPYNWMALQADTMPKYPSYMRVNICGQGTPYACPSREVPIPSLRSLAIGPNDPRLSAQARQN